MQTISFQEQEILRLFPIKFRDWLNRVFSMYKAEEVRVRIGRPPEMLFDVRRISAPEELAISEEDCAVLLENICCHSVYAWEEELKNGFITLNGGSRVGIAGKTIIEKGALSRFSCVTFFNFRIARECKGCANTAIEIIAKNKALKSSLIVSPPGAGKTTMLRDISRQLATECKERRAYKVCVVDERGEIAASWLGKPQMDVGEACDVLDGCPKHFAINMLIRTMSPEVIITDEIGKAEDLIALRDASYAGVAIIASAHGKNGEEYFMRPGFVQLFRNKVFERVIGISRENGITRITGVFDSHGERVEVGA